MCLTSACAPRPMATAAWSPTLPTERLSDEVLEVLDSVGEVDMVIPCVLERDTQ